MLTVNIIMENVISLRLVTMSLPRKKYMASRTYFQSTIDFLTDSTGASVSGGVFKPVEYNGIRYSSAFTFGLGARYIQ